MIANDPDADRCAVAVNDPRAAHATTAPETAGLARAGGCCTATRSARCSAQLVAVRRRRRRRPAARSPARSSPRACSAGSPLRTACEHAPTLTGFKWISRVDGLVFGYEEALGYCVDPGHVRDKDGISAALLIAQLADRLKAQGRTLVDALDDLARAHGLHLTDQLSARFTDLAQIAATMQRLRDGAAGEPGRARP